MEWLENFHGLLAQNLILLFFQCTAHVKFKRKLKLKWRLMWERVANICYSRLVTLSRLKLGDRRYGMRTFMTSRNAFFMSQVLKNLFLAEFFPRRSRSCFSFASSTLHHVTFFLLLALTILSSFA